METKILERYWKYVGPPKYWSQEPTKGYLKAHPRSAKAPATQPEAKKK